MDAFACETPCFALCMRLREMTHTESSADFGGYVALIPVLMGWGLRKKLGKIVEGDSCTGEARIFHRCEVESWLRCRSLWIPCSGAFSNLGSSGYIAESRSKCPSI